MLIIGKGKVIPDDDVVFFDGFLYVISGERDDKSDMKYSIDVICLTAEYDDPLTLADIAKKYPHVRKVIFDDAIRGYVYNHGNHTGCDKNAEAWEQVGTTCGYY